VRAERDEHGQRGHSPVQRLVDGREEQRQRAAPGAVGHEHADRTPVEGHLSQLAGDEAGDPSLAEQFARAADPRRTGSSHVRHYRCVLRLVHLGLGNFFRAHQAWYTARAPDADDWGYIAFTGRRPELADALKAQDGRYTLVTRAADGDKFELIGSLSQVHAAAEHEAWLGVFGRPELAGVTLTVTEAGYSRRLDGGLDLARADVAADLAALRADLAAPVRTVPGKLVAGFAARRRACAGPVALIPCDNLAANGALAYRVVLELAELTDPGLAEWVSESVAVVTTMVDRITPRTTEADVALVLDRTGVDDRCPVVTEPFSDWVLSVAFPAGRPAWEDAGATFTGDITPFEDRKLWLLNGGHSLLAYAGSILRHETVDQAVVDETCRGWLEQWWDVASPHLDQPVAEVAAYRAALLARFENPRIAHRLAQIAMDGSQKIAVRIIPVLRAERRAARMPTGATRVVAAWICHLRGLGAPVGDARAGQVVPLAAGENLAEAVRRVVTWLDPELGADRDLITVIADQCQELASGQGPR
jgi:fructuronate reductase